MTTLESLCSDYLQAEDEKQYRTLLEQIAQLFYSDPRISRILEAELHRAKLFGNRKDDLRHDVFLAFTGFVLPKLKYPERAIGAVHQTARNCVKRLNSNRYSTENESTILLDDPESDVQLEEALGADDTQEDRIIHHMTTQRAKQAIEAALANPTSEVLKTRCWIRSGYPTRPENDGQLQRVPVEKLPPATELDTRGHRYQDFHQRRELTDTGKWFFEAKDEIGLTVNTLSERLDILPATLRSYLDRRVSLPLDVYERMRKLVASKEGKDRREVYLRTKDMRMPEIVADWQKRTELAEIRDLAEVLGVQRGILSRWSRPKADGGDSRPHAESIYELEQKVVLYEKVRKKKG